jgi:hypothetical protein
MARTRYNQLCIIARGIDRDNLLPWRVAFFAAHGKVKEFQVLRARVESSRLIDFPSAPALADMTAGQVQVMFDNAASSIEHTRAVKLRAGARLSVAPIMVGVGFSAGGPTDRIAAIAAGQMGRLAETPSSKACVRRWNHWRRVAQAALARRLHVGWNGS